MTTYLGKSCSFGLPRVPFVNCRQFMYLVFSLLVLRAGCGIWLYQFLIIVYLFTLPRTGFLCGSNMYELFGLHEGLPTHQWKINSKHNIYNKSRLITDMKQDEYSTAKPTLKRWSKRNSTVEPRWARPKTDHQAPVNFIESLGDLRFSSWVWPHIFL